MATRRTSAKAGRERDAASEFWPFSLRVYGQPEVAAACLGLQERHGLDVNLLLLACWLGASGRGALGEPAWADLCAQVATWQRQVVLPLRQVRQCLKGMLPNGGPQGRGANADPIASLRRAVGECELDAEYLEQLMLERAVAMAGGDTAPVGAPFEAGAANLLAYLAVCGVEAGGELRPLSQLLAAAFPENEAQTVSARLQAALTAS